MCMLNFDNTDHMLAHITPRLNGHKQHTPHHGCIGINSPRLYRQHTPDGYLLSYHPNRILYLQSSPLLVLLQCHTIVSTAALGALPPPHLLTLVSLATGSQAATPITTTAQNQSVPLAAIVPPQSNPALPQPPHPLPIAGLVLSPAAEPFPRKLVDKVKSGQFVEVKELLADISLLNQLETIQGFPPLQMLGAARPRLREVTFLSTWCYCFLGYAAILASNPHHKGPTGIHPFND
jgi:hypothetical protein